MHFGEALSQISEIHAHLAKGEVYRGFRSLPVAISGVCGLLAALAQPWVIRPDDVPTVVGYWIAVAALVGAVGMSEALYKYAFRDDPYARRGTRKVLGQFVPCLAAGGAITVGLLSSSPTPGPSTAAWLPGLWAIAFSLGIFAARPYLPRAIGYVALYYLAAGFQLLLWAPGADGLSGWAVGGTFGIGQLAAALVLYWNLERDDHA